MKDGYACVGGGVGGGGSVCLCVLVGMCVCEWLHWSITTFAKTL